MSDRAAGKNQRRIRISGRFSLQKQWSAAAGESAAATAQAVTAADAPAQEAAPEKTVVRRSARKAVTEPAATQEPVTAGT